MLFDQIFQRFSSLVITGIGVVEYVGAVVVILGHEHVQRENMSCDGDRQQKGAENGEGHCIAPKLAWEKQI